MTSLKNGYKTDFQEFKTDFEQKHKELLEKNTNDLEINLENLFTMCICLHISIHKFVSAQHVAQFLTYICHSK